MKGYKQTLMDVMSDLAERDSEIVFIGYNVAFGKFGGTLSKVNDKQLIETPTAENLMTGIGIGLSLLGKRPVICFERFDFVLNALDAIVNHLDKIKALSGGQFRPACILRIVVGNKKKPLFTGLPHVQDFSAALDELVTFPVHKLETTEAIEYSYDVAYSFLRQGESTALIEYKDLYE